MGREYERLFGALPKDIAPAYLCERVFGAIYRERVRITRRRLVFSSCGAFLSLAGMLVALPLLISAMAASGFSSYASLLVSDGRAVAVSHAFFWSLLESLPGPEAALALFLLAVFIQSMRVLVASGIEWRAASPYLAAS